RSALHRPGAWCLLHHPPRRRCLADDSRVARTRRTDFPARPSCACGGVLLATQRRNTKASNATSRVCSIGNRLQILTKRSGTRQLRRGSGPVAWRQEAVMTAREFLVNISLILTVMAVGALIETAVPMFVAGPWRQGRRMANLSLTVVSFLSNWLLASMAAIAALTLRPAGAMARLDWPMWLDIIVGIVVLDLSVGYLSHRTMHMWPAMWRFHRVHHSDAFVDVTTTYRTHPVETAWRFLFAIVPIWALGLPAQAVVIQRLLQATNGVIEHANIRLWPPLDRVLSTVWVTPNVHKIHHSLRLSET